MKLSSPPDLPALVRRGARAVLILTITAAPAMAAPDRPSVSPQQGVSVAGPRPEAGRRRLSKYEARKARHACAARAMERGLAGAERENFVANCYFSRLAHRGERQRCRQEAAAKGIDRSALRDFLRGCVKERSRD
ncbi:hypothetical protein [Methylosinus sp. Sm6]|uniref:hypothetical protein n=1 Tax=Methylosinus sp. Sm6 TaxID=2866948 RepID=UPI001C99A000|nr:hypothetical protein [Methylosinus sp. Sm6]MBY6241011.1 hypothetical protein [Methylosinus sp. Sm6]